MEDGGRRSEVGDLRLEIRGRRSAVGGRKDRSLEDQTLGR